MPRSRDQDSAAQMGHSRPAITRVGRTPTSSIISDVTMAPTPMERATRLSSTPKTRASTSSGAILPRSVNPPRSISALPTPTQGEESQRRDLLGEDADQRHGHTPERHPDGEPRAQPPGVDQQ